MRDLEDSPVVAIFLVLTGGHEEREEDNGGRRDGLTDARAVTRQNSEKCGGKVIPRIDGKVAGLWEITSAFPFWDVEKKFGREILFRSPSSFLFFHRLIFCFASHRSHNVDLHVSPSAPNIC